MASKIKLQKGFGFLLWGVFFHLSLPHILPLLPQFLLGKPVAMPDQVEVRRVSGHGTED